MAGRQTEEGEISPRKMGVSCCFAFASALLVFQSFPSFPAWKGGSIQYPSLALLALAVGLVAGLFNLKRYPVNAGIAACAVLAGFGIRSLIRSQGTFLAAPAHLGKIAITVCVASAVAAGLAFLCQKGYRKLAVTLAFAGVCFCFAAQSFRLVRIASNPQTKQYSEMHEREFTDYTYDGYIYAQTLNNMEKGKPYYDALRQAMSRDSRYVYDETTPFDTIFFARQPMVSLMLKALPGSTLMSSFLAFLIFSFAVAVAAYLFVRRFCEPAFGLVAFFLLGNYFLLNAGTTKFHWLFAEIWAAGFIVLALWALVTKRLWISAVFLVLACASREFSFALLPVWVLSWALSGKEGRKQWAPYVFAIVAAVGAFYLHFSAAPLVSQAAGTTGSSLAIWLKGSTKDFVGVLRFLTKKSLVYASAMWVVPFVALVGSFAAREKRYRYPLALLIVGFIIFYRFIGTTPYPSTQWGAFGMPFFMLVATLVGGFCFPSRTNFRRKKPRDIQAIRVVLPAYNEEDSIVDLLQELAHVLESIGIPWSVLVMDDGSSDETAVRANATLPKERVSVLTNEENLGLGGNISKGLQKAGSASKPGEVIITMDADLTQSPDYIPSMLEEYRAGFDVVIASRYRRGSKVEGLSAVRKTLTLGARVLLSLVFPILNVRDYSCGYRLYDARLLKDYFTVYGDRLIQQTGFACMAELLLKLREGLRVSEVPFVLLYGRKRKGSAMNVSATSWSYAGMMADVVKLDYVCRPPRLGS